MTGIVLPQALDVEKTVIGSILTDPRAAEIAFERLDESCFYSGANRKIFECMRSMFEKNAPIDLVTLAEALKKRSWLVQVGEEPYLAELSENLTTAGNIDHYAGILQEKALLRKTIEICNDGLNKCTNPDAFPRSIIEEMEQNFLSITTTKTDSKFYSPSDVIPEVLENAERAARGICFGVATGLPSIDSAIGGLEPGSLYIIAGRPSSGKTSLATAIALNIAKRKLIPVFFSLEMSRIEIIQRIVCSEGEVDLARLRTGQLPKRDYQKFAHTLAIVNELPMLIDDSGIQSAATIRTKSRRLKRSKNLDVIFVDHLGLLANESKKSENRAIDLGIVTRSLKLTAKLLQVPVILLCQLNRDVEKRENKRPVLADLRESGAIEQDADVVMMVYRPSQYEQSPENVGLAEVIIAKQRNGPTGRISLTFKEFCAKFCEKEGNW